MRRWAFGRRFEALYGELGDVDGHAEVVPDETDGCDLGGAANRIAARENGGCDATGSDEMGRSEIERYLRLELVGRVAIAVDDEYLVAEVQPSPPTIRELDPAVLADAIDAREHEVARPGTNRARQQ